MSSSFAAATYKPQIRQEGFHLPSPPPSIPSPSLSDPMFSHFLPDPFRKSSSSSSADPHGSHGQTSHLDFSDELASLIPPSSHERSTHSPDDHQQHQQQPQEHHYRHNIFDISAPTFAAAYPPAPSSYDYAPSAPPPPHFNSTVPAIGSSLRYDDQHPHQQPTPSSYASTHIDYARESANRSRSRSRGPAAAATSTTNGGPARTQRPKRGSISSTSPPRHPHAILIPPHASLSARSANNGNANNNNPVSPLSLHSLSTSTPNGWFPTHDYGSLPTPDSLGGPTFGSYPPTSALGVSPKDASSSVVDSTVGLDAAAKQQAIANEKRRRRRESHNAVERRRRDNINEKIAELATLIPESMLDAGAPVPTSPADATTPPKDDDDATSAQREKEREKERDGGVKANKGMILRKSVEYIRYLQQLVAAQAQRNRELEVALASGGGSSGNIVGAPLPHVSEAEREMVVIADGGAGLFGGAGGGRVELERVVEEQRDVDEEDAMDIKENEGSDDVVGARGRTQARRVKEEDEDEDEDRHGSDDMEVS